MQWSGEVGIVERLPNQPASIGSVKSSLQNRVQILTEARDGVCQ
jgi:hypothetical protein